MFNTSPRFRRVQTITSPIAVTTAPTTVIGNGMDIRVKSLSGNTWVNPLGTASATANSIRLATGEEIDIIVPGNLSMVSDATGSTVQIIIFEG